jgi:hypothetical protein
LSISEPLLTIFCYALCLAFVDGVPFAGRADASFMIRAFHVFFGLSILITTLLIDEFGCGVMYAGDTLCFAVSSEASHFIPDICIERFFHKEERIRVVRPRAYRRDPSLLEK